ncbi:hypothetical protein LIER_39667 [Lithospermum erythrorhizon]|uniref:Uncharacterized protein n=1 Tax=Lithospermum erythrorhizon TaxID=34254 RepID=A0AAV3QKX5_LITER
MARTRDGKITKDKTKMAEEASSNDVLENHEYPIPLRVIAGCVKELIPNLTIFDGPRQLLEEDVFINTTQVESPKSGADKDLGGNEEADSVINEVQVSPSKGKSSEPGNIVHENEIEEDVHIVGNSVSQPADDSVKNLGESVVGESSINPPVTGTMNIQEEYANITGGDKENEAEDEVTIEKDDGKLKINDTRKRVNNKRIPKNVAPVSTVGIALNSKDEEAKWKFIYNRKLAPERVLSDVTKRNMVIMNIIKEVGILSVVDNVGPYWPKLVREFICNLPRDVDDSESNNYQKVTLRNFVFNFSPDLINKAYGRTNEGDTGDSLLLSDIVSTLIVGSVTIWPPKSQLASSKLSVKYVVLHKVDVICLVPTTHTTSIGEALTKALYMLGSGFLSLICSLLRAQHPEVLAKTNEENIVPKSFPITHKLLSGTHVTDIPIQDVGTDEVIIVEQTAVVKIFQDEIAHLDGVIQSSLFLKQRSSH